MAKARLRWLVLPHLHHPDLAPRAWAQALLDSHALAGFQPDLVFATAVAQSDAADAYGTPTLSLTCWP